MAEDEEKRQGVQGTGLTAKQEYCLQLYQQHHEEIRRYITRYVKNPHDVDDLMQTVFLNVLAHPGDPENLRAYLYAVARNQVCFYWRRRKRSVLSAEMLSRGAGANAAGKRGQALDMGVNTKIQSLTPKSPKRKRRGGSGSEGGRPLTLRVPVGVGRGGLPGSKISGRPSRARNEGSTGHRWLRGDPEGEAVIPMFPKESACARLFQNHSGHAGPRGHISIYKLFVGDPEDARQDRGMTRPLRRFAGPALKIIVYTARIQSV